MSKNNEYKKLQSWDPKPEVQRAAEKQFYDNEPQEMRHKKKSRKTGKARSDHKHNYIAAVICYETYGNKYSYIGKVCDVCGHLCSKNWRKELRNYFAKKNEQDENLPVYEKLDENTARIIK